MYKTELEDAPCIGCGALVRQRRVQRVMCWDCRSGLSAESPGVLSEKDGAWVNDRGVMRWKEHW